MSEGFDIHGLLSDFFYKVTGEKPTQGDLRKAVLLDEIERDRSRQDLAQFAYDPTVINLPIPLMSYEEVRTFSQSGWNVFTRLMNIFRSGFRATDTEKVNDVEQTLREHRHNVIIGMLDQWNASIKKEIEADNKKVEKRAQFNHYMEKQALARIIRRMRDLYDERFEVTLVPTAMGLISVIGSAPVRVDVDGDGDLDMVSAAAISKALSFLDDVIPEKVRPEMLFIINHFVNTVAFQTALMNPAWMVNTGTNLAVGPEVRHATVKEFEAMVISLIKSKDYDLMIKNILVARAEEVGIDPSQIKSLKVIVALTLAFIALSIYYKDQTGGLTAEEIGALILNGGGERPKCVEDSLVNLIHFELQKISSRQEREKIINGLLKFADTKPNFDSLLDSSEVFRRALGDGMSEEEDIEQANTRPI